MARQATALPLVAERACMVLQPERQGVRAQMLCAEETCWGVKSLVCVCVLSRFFYGEVLLYSPIECRSIREVVEGQPAEVDVSQLA